jgi:hypothetical protein
MRRRESERHPWPVQAWPVAGHAKGALNGRPAAFRAAVAAAGLRRRGGSTRRRSAARPGDASTRRGLRPLRATWSGGL